MPPLHAVGMPADAETPDDKAKTVQGLVADNVAKLVPVTFGRGATAKGIKEIRDASGIPNGTVGRIVSPGAESWGVSWLAPLAKALKVQPWQLLLPDLTVTTDGVVVSLEGMKARQWPFPTLRREEIEGLTPVEIERLEKTIRNRVAELKEDRPATEKQFLGKRAQQ